MAKAIIQKNSDRLRKATLKQLKMALFGMLFAVIILSANTIAFGYPIKVEGESMNPTIKNDQIVFINTKEQNYARYDIIETFSMKNANETMIKRIYGLPGETITMKDNYIYINGEKLDKVYYDTNANIELGCLEDGVTLQDDEYFVLGDNIEVSNDSRQKGPIKEMMIIGKKIF